MYRALCGNQGGKCFVCAGSLAAPGRSRIQRKLRAWVLAGSDLPGEEICQLANDTSNFVVFHTACLRGMRNMRKRFSAGKTILAFASLNASVRNADTDTLGVKAPHPIEAAARDPLKNP
jgi:hypothetical protein